MQSVQKVDLTNREDLVVTCCNKVIELNKKTLIIDTNLNKMIVNGQNLEIKSFDDVNKKLHLTGKIDSISYTDDKAINKSIISKVFK